MNELAQEIDLLLKNSVKVTFRGKYIQDAGEVSDELLREDECCMRDYVINDYGRLTQVNFDIIKDY